ncbi:AKR_HP2_G0023540.mRNA.1.CDS.1 [Saccharomyces cerevisiae]|nr:AKR_HP2_G0023540.mRNA.1.CDS.1 [Saccharomyces cerevisiae]CAI6473017.1 AKR_HP2_G0023540.mRNA.1.CDS.1 [Saccharomyces cerevisiae]
MRLKEQRKKEQEENIAKRRLVHGTGQRKLERRKLEQQKGGPEGQGKDDDAMSDEPGTSSSDMAEIRGCGI